MIISAMTFACAPAATPTGTPEPTMTYMPIPTATNTPIPTDTATSSPTPGTDIGWDYVALGDSNADGHQKLADMLRKLGYEK